jgi:hypothetical protein
VVLSFLQQVGVEPELVSLLVGRPLVVRAFLYSLLRAEPVKAVLVTV